MDSYKYHIFSPYRVCPLGAHICDETVLFRSGGDTVCMDQRSVNTAHTIKLGSDSVVVSQIVDVTHKDDSIIHVETVKEKLHIQNLTHIKHVDLHLLIIDQLLIISTLLKHLVFVRIAKTKDLSDERRKSQ